MKENVVHVDIRKTLANRDFLTVCCDALKLPFRNGVFNIVHASHVLEHIFNPLECLKEIKRVCCGSVIIKIPKPTVRTSYEENPEHIFTWEVSSFSNLLSLVFSDFEVYPTRRLTVDFPFLQQTFNRMLFWLFSFLSFDKMNEITAICKVKHF